MKIQVLEKKYGSDLASTECKDLKLQLTDKDIVIGNSMRRALKELLPDQQRNTVLGIHSFFGTTLSYLQQKLPLNNQLPRQLGCWNPAKRKTQQYHQFKALLLHCSPKSLRVKLWMNGKSFMYIMICQPVIKGKE